MARTQSADTSAEAEAVQIALLQRAPIWRKLALLDDLNRTLRVLAVGELRRKHEGESAAQINRRLADLRLGLELAARVYGPHALDPDGEEESAMETTAIAVMLLVIEQLEAMGVSYVLGGSLASGAHGIYRATNDADIMADLSLEQADGLARSLEGVFYVDAESIREAIRRRSSFNVIHLTSMFKVDIFIPKRRAFERSEIERRVRAVVSTDPNRHAYLASAEDIVLAKLDWYRQGGEVSDRQWNDLISVLKVRASSLDRDYLLAWAANLGVRDLLDRALDDAGLL